MVLVILVGLTKNQIPYEAQIIRVADEYDAIVSKRQYKSHVGISDTLKILIENTKPRKSDAIAEVVKHSKHGKNNPAIVRVLIKVVIEDIEYEIFLTQSYVEELKGDLKRLKQAMKYKVAMDKAKKEKDKNYYLEGIKYLLKPDEKPENLDSTYQEYEKAYETRKAIIENLYQEIKIIKKLRV